MPIYTYQVIEDDGSEGEIFEVEQSMKEPTLTVHPVTGKRVKRVYHPPNLAYKHTPGRIRNLTADENVEKAGFTKYVRDKVTGQYHRTAGKNKAAPDVLDPS